MFEFFKARSLDRNDKELYLLLVKQKKDIEHAIKKLVRESKKLACTAPKTKKHQEVCLIPILQADAREGIQTLSQTITLLQRSIDHLLNHQLVDRQSELTEQILHTLKRVAEVKKHIQEIEDETQKTHVDDREAQLLYRTHTLLNQSLQLCNHLMKETEDETRVWQRDETRVATYR